MTILYAVLTGFFLDCLLGDPHWLPHPVRLIGLFISSGERWLRKISCRTDTSRFVCGMALAVVTVGLSAAVPLGILLLLGRVSVWLRVAVESVMCYQMIAMKSLRTESMKVCHELQRHNLPGAREKLSWIVGRDTQHLDEAHVIRAAVETVAENTSDGVTAPLLYMLIGGAPLGFFYKAVNTLDSMIGYSNERYLYFGRFAARLDDAVNFIPARLTGLMMLPASFLAGLDFRNAARIFRRDRKKHRSPNSANTEAACAGALDVRLGGFCSYLCRLVFMPSFCDALRPFFAEDIRRANRLTAATSLLFLLVGAGVRFWILWSIR